MKKLPIKYLVILAVLILTCSVLSNKLSGKETLQDYAEKNPEVAYATKELLPVLPRLLRVLLRLPPHLFLFRLQRKQWTVLNTKPASFTSL